MPGPSRVKSILSAAFARGRLGAPRRFLRVQRHTVQRRNGHATALRAHPPTTHGLACGSCQLSLLPTNCPSLLLCVTEFAKPFPAGLCTCCLQKSRCGVPPGNGFANSLFISVSVLKRTFFTFYACSEEPEMDLVSHPDPKRNHFQEA